MALGKRVVRDDQDASEHDAARKCPRAPLVKEVETTTTTTERHYALPTEAQDAAPAAAPTAAASAEAETEAAANPAPAPPPQISGGSYGRSREEFALGGYTLHGLGLPCARDDVLSAIQLGDDNGRVDVTIQLGDPGGADGVILLLEWDGVI